LISVEFIIVPFTNDSGQMIGIAAIMRDVTARWMELRALRRQLAAHPPTARTAAIPSRNPPPGDLTTTRAGSWACSASTDWVK
jgi:hypothetical protein